MTFDEWLKTRDGQVACVARNVAANTGTQTDDALRLAWNAALEEAAKVCEALEGEFDDRDAPHHAGGASECADRIRLRIESSPR